MDCINLVQDSEKLRDLVKAVINVWVSYNAGNFLPSLGNVSFSRRPLFHGVFFSLWRRASQQKLRTHRSLKAYCAILVIKMKRKMIRGVS